MHDRPRVSFVRMSVLQRRKRNELPLQKKVELIKKADANPSFGIRKLAELFECGRTQVSVILKSRAKFLDLYESNASSKLVRKRERTAQYTDINVALHEWFVLATSKNIYPDGPLLSCKAKEIAERMGISEFKASNGWLHKWKQRYNIKQVSICGESADVRGDTVTSWKERLPEIVSGYAQRDIWNLDETGLFWKALPDKGFAEKASKCKGGKKIKVRITVALIVDALGETQRPIVIGMSANPRCFKNVKKDQLPVDYYSQKKAWMTGEILNDVLLKINRRLQVSKRSILLLLDNAGCHPADMKGRFSNTKIIFLPPNTTSMLQPLDLGIIQNFKVHYRKLFLGFILTKIDECSNASEIVKSVTILHSIRWIAQAWAQVRQDTIQKCFRRAGVLADGEILASALSESADPFSDLDDELELEDLISKVHGGTESCQATEFVSGDDCLQVCQEFGEEWEDTFLDNISSSCKRADGGEEEELEEIEEANEEDESDHEELCANPISSMKEAIMAMENVYSYLEQKGHTSLASDSMKLHSDLSTAHRCELGASKQTTLQEYFTVD